MEMGETDRKKFQVQVPWIPTTPLKPILPIPVPIYTPGEGNQLGSHPTGVHACFESSAGAEINGRQHRRSAPEDAGTNIAGDSARTSVEVSFDNISSSSNSFAELLAQVDAPSAYSYATHAGVLKNQFVPTLNSEFNPTYTLLDHCHLSCEQPSLNTIHDNYHAPQGTSYFAYYGKTTCQVSQPTPDIAGRAERRQVAAMQMNMEERVQGEEEKTVQATECINDETPHNKELCDPVLEFTAVSTPCKENHNHNKAIIHDIDLNKTPQPKPRRRKHRPKVIKEGKSKQTKKPVTPKPVQSKENPTGKRKYVRKKVLNTTTPQTEVTREWTEELLPESAKKTCRRSLNFDQGEQPRDGSSACREIGVVVEETQSLNNYMSLYEETQAPSASLSKGNSPGAKPNPNSVENISKRKGQMIAWDGHENKAKSCPDDSNRSKRRISTRGPQLVGSKRKHSGASEHADTSSINLSGAQHNGLQAYYPECWVQFPNVQKKRRSEKAKSSDISSMTTTKDVQLTTWPQEDARSHPYASSSNCWSSGPEYVPVVNSATERPIHDKPQSFEYNLSLGQRGLTKRRSRVPTRIHDCASLSFFRNSDIKLTHTAKQEGSSDRQTSGDAERPLTCIDAMVAQMSASHTKKKRTRKRSTPVSSADCYTNKMQQQHKLALENHCLPLDNSFDAACEKTWKNIRTADALTERFRHLNINREARALVLHGQNALVPYNQQNQKHKDLVHGYGAIIPFEGSFDPIRKQRPRPKVDLDDETNRVWKLLMLDINSHGIDGADEDKAKWWEQERNVFRGRADSFIARMHLVQGDRRFSQWKGSVVDSVIGVFLTQNVSDHLSSSAFMSLAARFPLKSSRRYKAYHEDTSLIANKPLMHIMEPEESTKLDEKMSNQSVYDLSSMTIDIIEHSEEKEAVDSNDSCRTAGSLLHIIDESNFKLLESAQRHIREQHSPMESGPHGAMTGEGQQNSCDAVVQKEFSDIVSPRAAVITSHTSGDFSVDQSPEKIGSCSDSNSEVEDPSSAAKYNIFRNRTSFSKLLEMASSTMLHEVNSQRSKSTENLGDAYSQSIGRKHDELTENLEKSAVTQGSLEASIITCDDFNLKMTPNSGVLEVNCHDPFNIETSSSHFSKNTDENDMKGPSFPTTESETQAAIANSQSMLSQLHLNQQSNRQQQNAFHISGQTQEHVQKARELEFGDHNNAMRNANSKTNSAPVKLKSRGRQKEKKDKFDWDSLRIQAQAKAGKREKTENTMDSLDWDAVRRADVSEIADAIKERGMNNMLAERIKNFLNLLVDAHGAIDLEWLRDVPPDQAKEYLLSIKGLGLKSVECVRLLTLHHLAFPVDTNVGRIAVRLGWVPLQPLPESLQLHLLELYPVLESIQKYLWPRLCKLDQRTLYELHYQLITFGKVFCTKHKPNCNACPMRAECRHFASAFASARLALPGPEQRSIVTTNGNKATDQSPSVILNQLTLPLPDNTDRAQELQQTEVSRQLEAKSEMNTCQPIIEEPATPEPECSQVLENDMEDFCNESCEIPPIDVDIEELNLNLQNYMQERMELHDGETSKAMVVLSPEAACIPTPKLKNVSRLRTEHCVYELPDSHCLLEGWEKREPDDPGKYLLAIWTPGETANSIQPPERKCSSQDSFQLCNDKECFSCNSFREANSQIVRGTILIPCRTAMKGSFPLNGTYFQVNEVFADHDSSVNPINVPRSWIWNLNRRTVYFGTSVPTIFKGLTTQEIQQCFWRGFVCVRGFDRETRAPRPLQGRLHYPASKLAKTRDNNQEPTSASSQGLNLGPNPEEPQLLSNTHKLRERDGA